MQQVQAEWLGLALRLFCQEEFLINSNTIALDS